MILISYDIADNKLRTRFARFITKFGHRLQYSVYEIDNSRAILDNIRTQIEQDWVPKFKETDSVMIFLMSETCTIIRCGYAKHDEEDLIIVG
jgi:CRISPR-associated protein Cas2